MERSMHMWPWYRGDLALIIMWLYIAVLGDIGCIPEGNTVLCKQTRSLADSVRDLASGVPEDRRQLNLVCHKILGERQ